VGRILKALEASKVAAETLVVFTADHGIPYPGAKWTLFDPGIETPLVMYRPGTAMAGGKVFEQLMSNVDFLPTLLDLVGVDRPANLHGHSFRAVIEGRRKESFRREVYAQRTSHALYDNLSRCVRTERYKLIRYFEPGRSVIYPTDAVPQRVAGHVERPRRKGGRRPVVELYDLKADPHERNNLAQRAEHADTVRELSDKLWTWMGLVGDPLLEGPLRRPGGRSAARRPVADTVLRGGDAGLPPAVPAAPIRRAIGRIRTWIVHRIRVSYVAHMPHAHVFCVWPKWLYYRLRTRRRDGMALARTGDCCRSWRFQRDLRSFCDAFLLDFGRGRVHNEVAFCLTLAGGGSIMKLLFHLAPAFSSHHLLKSRGSLHRASRRDVLCDRFPVEAWWGQGRPGLPRRLCDGTCDSRLRRSSSPSGGFVCDESSGSREK